MPQYILIKEIKDGMILSDSIVNNFGQTLLPAGSVLKESHFRFFRTWNITGIMIKSDVEDEDKELSPELIKIAKARLQKRMNWSPKNNIEQDLFEMAIIKMIKMPKVS